MDKLNRSAAGRECPITEADGIVMQVKRWAQEGHIAAYTGFFWVCATPSGTSGTGTSRSSAVKDVPSVSRNISFTILD